MVWPLKRFLAASLPARNFSAGFSHLPKTDFRCQNNVFFSAFVILRIVLVSLAIKQPRNQKKKRNLQQSQKLLEKWRNRFSKIASNLYKWNDSYYMTHIIWVMNHFIKSFEKPLSVQREESESKKRRASGTLTSQSSKKRKTDSWLVVISDWLLVFYWAIFVNRYCPIIYTTQNRFPNS